MLRGLYTAAAGMLATTVATDTLANNLANINTIGFKANKINYQSFPEMLIHRMSRQGDEVVGGLMTGSQIQQSFVNHMAGPLRTTGNTFDLAIEGDGFFTVKTPDGQTYYTRAGNFTVNDQGFVTTLNGDYVQGELGNILLNLDNGPFRITRAGDINSKNGTIDQLKITRFENNQTLEKFSDNLYRSTERSKALPPPLAGEARGYQVHQGTLEESNVNSVTELVNNIQGIRLYEALQKNIHLHNETLGKAVNEVGRTR